MQGKGRQFVPHGKKVMMAFPGGAGYGNATDREPELVKRDLARGYITEASAKNEYGLSDNDINQVKAAVKDGSAV
jgi:N-methylhydantoinase B